MLCLSFLFLVGAKLSSEKLHVCFSFGASFELDSSVEGVGGALGMEVAGRPRIDQRGGGLSTRGRGPGQVAFQHPLLPASPHSGQHIEPGRPRRCHI